MKNQQRAELSKKNPWYIPKEKYYEMLYFSRQYPTMREELRDLRKSYPTINMDEHVTNSDTPTPTEKAAARCIELRKKMELIEETAKEAGGDIARWLLIGVTTTRSYEYLALKMDMPLCRSSYYERYRKYFYLLAQKR
jgi:hypothetical protein